MRIWKKIGNFLSYAALIAGVLIIALPMYLSVVTAFKTKPEIARNFFAPPESFFLGNFIDVINSTNFFSFVKNSTLITVVSLGVILIFIPMVSFPIARKSNQKYYKFLYAYFLSAIFVPFQVVMLPIVKLMNSLNLMNQVGMILLYITLSLSQGVFLCVGYLKSIPRQLDEAAYIEGCTVWQMFIKVIYPLMLPIVVTVMIMDALWIWNDYLLPLVILNKTQEYWTLPLFQYNFKGQYSADYNLAFAAFLLSTLPILIVYSIFQKYIIGGLTEGAIKS